MGIAKASTSGTGNGTDLTFSVYKPIIAKEGVLRHFFLINHLFINSIMVNKKLFPRKPWTAVLTWLVAILALTPMRLSARDFTYKYQGTTLTYTVISEDDKTVMTKEGNSAYQSPGNSVSGSLIIPATVTDGNTEYTVTTIGNHAFDGCSGLTSVTIGNSVTSIGSSAFSYCSGLTSVTIPESVTTIGYNAFYGCSDLNEVIYNAENCTSCGPYSSSPFPSTLPKLTIGNNVKTIPASAFSGCSKLTEVVIPEKVSSIGSEAFKGCSDLKKTAYPNTLNNPFPSSIWSISIAYNPEGAFIENGFVYGADKKTIYYAPLSLNGDYTLPESVTSIGKGAFWYCTGLSSVAISNSVTSIGDYAFYYCTGLSSVTIPNSVTSIGSSAFDSCSGLTSVTLPESVTTIGYSAFSQCTALTYVNIPKSVKSIGMSAFLLCSALTSVDLEPGLTTIGLYIFSGCISLTNVIIPNSVTTIEKGAFQNCTGLTNINIQDGVTTIGDEAFQGCSGLTNIKIPNSITSIGSSAFKDCPNLTSVTLPNRLKTIGSNAFIDLPLTSLEIPNSVTTIGWSAFSGNALKQLVIPASVEKIGSDAFRSQTLEIAVIKSNKTFSLDIFGEYGDYAKPVVMVNKDLIESYKYYVDDYTILPIVNFELASEEGAFEVMPNSNKTLPLSLSIAEHITGFQTDITLPAGLAIAEKNGKLDVTLGAGKSASHVVTASKVSGDNKYRIVGYSSKNELFTNGDNLLNIGIVTDSNMKGGDIIVGPSIFTMENDLSYTAYDEIINVPSFIGVRGVTITPAEATINCGQTLELKAEVTPVEAWNKTMKWTSSDTNVATVDADGVVTPVAKGTVTITATATDGSEVSGTAVITVTNFAQSITIGEENMTVEEDETVQLNPVFYPADADMLGLDWTSTDYSVAYVDELNVLHALVPGSAVLTAVNKASGLSATINLTVTAVLYGDSNDNGAVAIDDVVTDVQYILEQNPTPFSFKKADVNRDRTVNIIDVSKTVTIVLSSNSSAARVRSLSINNETFMDGMTANEVNVEQSGHALMTISMADVTDITAIQGDINLPAGINVTDIRLSGSQNGDHIVDFAQISDEDVRFAIYSLSLDRLGENAPVLEVELDCCHDYLERYALVSDIYASDTDCNLHNFEPFYVTIKDNYSGVEDINPDNISFNADIYNLQGICLKHNATADDIKALAPGLYIIGDKKVLIK